MCTGSGARRTWWKMTKTEEQRRPRCDAVKKPGKDDADGDRGGGVKPDGRRKEGEAKRREEEKNREREVMKNRIEDEGREGRSLEGHEQPSSSGNCSKTGRALLIRGPRRPGHVDTAAVGEGGRGGIKCRLCLHDVSGRVLITTSSTDLLP